MDNSKRGHANERNPRKLSAELYSSQLCSAIQWADFRGNDYRLHLLPLFLFRLILVERARFM